MKSFTLVFLALFMSMVSATFAGPATTIIDNRDAGFSASANWKYATSGYDKYGPDYRYYVASHITLYDPASWRPLYWSNSGGKYQISAWWAAGTNRTPRATFILPDGKAVYVNQQVNGGRWNLLGTAIVSPSATSTSLSNSSPIGYIIIADAVKYYGPLP